MTRTDAERYLSSLGARRDPRSNAAKVFGWVPRLKQWFQVTAEGPGVVNVTLHTQCPCSGKAS